MGMGERKTRAKAFKQQTDKVVAEEIKSANLFSTKVVESELTYECVRLPEDAPVKVGDRARLVDMRSQIDVFIGVNSVGYVAPNLVQSLRDTLKLGQRRGRSIAAQVVDVSDITPTFVVRVDKH
jgi:hypothetical protein